MQNHDFDEIVSSAKSRLASYSCNLFCCASTGCLSSGCQSVMDALKEALEARNLQESVRIVPTGCMGLCSHGPLLRVEGKGLEPVLYSELEPVVARLVVAEHIAPMLQAISDGNNEFDVPGFLKKHTLPLDLPFFKEQKKIVLANAGRIDPDSIDDYLAKDGFTGLKKALSLKPEEIIKEVDISQLRGRGGGGFPTARKWRNTFETESDEKFMICNGDEGDPGAYMDRSILEGDPYAVLEGMAIAGYAIGATSGWLYIRAEYPLAVERIEKAIRNAKKLKLLGKNILGTDYSFDCEVRLGAGAFVCGEETALIASIEGKRGTPRPRPPYPSEKGLWEKPSCVNNVETLANIPAIIRNGGEWYASIGSEASKGTKVFALTGKVKHSGLIEAPMGMSLKDIIEKIGGGSPDGKKLKAVQTGGPSGGVIPVDLFDTTVCYEELKKLGSIMGSGGMIVMDEDDDMVDISCFYLEFTVDESCGKCAPCRIGGRQLLDLLKKVSDGKAVKSDLEQIKRVCEVMQKASLCGLGQTAPNPALSSLKYFEEDFLKKLKPETEEDKEAQK
jgi:NADH:ubiquinone oxidoreductase subunit F (NADH-binding)/(2Fe-2S) ferredoxin